MLIVFFDIKGIVMTEWVPEGQTVNQTYYLSVLATLRERVRKKRPELWKNNSWILHQDNAPAHNALSVTRYLADKRTPVLQHAPYSPDLAPCDFFFVPEDKSCFERDPIWVDGSGKAKNGRSPKGPHQIRLPALLRSMEKTYGKGCGEGRGVYWRGAFESKIIFIIKPFFVTSLVIP